MRANSETLSGPSRPMILRRSWPTARSFVQRALHLAPGCGPASTADTRSQPTHSPPARPDPSRPLDRARPHGCEDDSLRDGVDGCGSTCKQQVGGSSPSASSGTARSGCWRARLGSPPASPPLERATQPWCVAVLGRFRVERRVSGEASSVMAGAEVGGWSVLGRGCLGAGVERRAGFGGRLDRWIIVRFVLRPAAADTTVPAACRHCRGRRSAGPFRAPAQPAGPDG